MKMTNEQLRNNAGGIDAEELGRFEPGLDAIRKEILKVHREDLDTEVYIYLTPGEFSRDGRRLLVHTETIEVDCSPFLPKEQRFVWYGAGVLDAASGEMIYVDPNLYYHGMISNDRVWSHGASLDHSGGRLLAYGSYLTIRSIPACGDEKKLAQGEILYADFADDDRYVFCIDADRCARVIDTTTGEVVSEKVLSEIESDTFFSMINHL